MKGVKDCIVGYTGGSTSSPTYHSLGNHTEALLVEFDPSVLSYEAVVKRFFASHSWSQSCSRSTQYRSAIWFGDAKQESIVLNVVKALELETGRKCTTAVEKATPVSFIE